MLCPLNTHWLLVGTTRAAHRTVFPLLGRCLSWGNLVAWRAGREGLWQGACEEVSTHRSWVWITVPSCIAASHASAWRYEFVGGGTTLPAQEAKTLPARSLPCPGACRIVMQSADRLPGSNGHEASFCLRLRRLMILLHGFERVWFPTAVGQGSRASRPHGIYGWWHGCTYSAVMNQSPGPRGVVGSNWHCGCCFFFPPI